MSTTDRLIAQCYFNEAIKDPITLASKIDRHLRDKKVDFDTFVVTGISGAIVGPLAAFAMNKNILFVRKGESCHTYKQVVGRIGKRWVFLDDFTETGETLRRCMQQVREFAADEGFYTPEGEFHTTFVGAVLYNSDRLFGNNPEDWRGWYPAEAMFEMHAEMLKSEIEHIKPPPISRVVDSPRIRISGVKPYAA